MLETIAGVLGAFVALTTTLSLVRAKAWWVRVWDFPRAQVAVLLVAAAAAAAASFGVRGPARAGFLTFLLAAAAH